MVIGYPKYNIQRFNVVYTIDKNDSCNAGNYLNSNL